MAKLKTIKAKVPGFAAVRDRDKGRDSVRVETKSDDELLAGNKRTLLIASHREDFRNTTFSPASSLQLKLNVVGSVGGKLTVVGVDGAIDDAATSQFRRWARHAEFTRGTALNDLLSMLLMQITHLGGDYIAVLDRGELTHTENPTLRVKIFEPDQIRNIPDKDFKALYPEVAADGKPEYVQLDGIVKNSWGQIVGAFVGESRGEEPFKTGEYLALKRLAIPGDFTQSNWVHVGNIERPNQQRGISPLAHVANQLADIASIQNSEISAAKINGGLGLIFSETAQSSSAGVAGGVGDALDDIAADDGELSPEDAKQLEELTKRENEALKQASVKMAEGQSAVVRLRPNTDIKSFDTQRPNLNVVEFYDRMIDISGTVYGLTQMFTRLKPQGSYSAARAEMAMVKPVFVYWQKVLERYFLDWLAVRVLDAYGFRSVDIEGRLLWSWPTLEEVDEGSHQTALQKMFVNGEKNLIDIHGADTVAFLDRRAKETEMFHARGLVAPWELTTSGAQIDPSLNIEQPQTEGN